jgi:hypothetical protein
LFKNRVFLSLVVFCCWIFSRIAFFFSCKFWLKKTHPNSTSPENSFEYWTPIESNFLVSSVEYWQLEIVWQWRLLLEIKRIVRCCIF